MKLRFYTYRKMIAVFAGGTCILFLMGYFWGVQQKDTSIKFSTQTATQVCTGTVCDFDSVCESPCENIQNCSDCGYGTGGPEDRMCDANGIPPETAASTPHDCGECTSLDTLVPGGCTAYENSTIDYIQADCHKCGGNTGSCSPGNANVSCIYSLRTGAFLEEVCDNDQNLTKIGPDGGIDDDQDGIAGCADSDCIGHPACTNIVPPTELICDDDLDNDHDGDIDCDDSDCVTDPACILLPQPGTEVLCNDGVDNDTDGDIDCDDSDCASDPACTIVPPSSGETICDDGIDNDTDGDVDCDDSDCASDPACATLPPSSGELVCDDGIDNDTDGDIDCADSDCDNDPVCQQSGSGSSVSCGPKNNTVGYVDPANPFPSNTPGLCASITMVIDFNPKTLSWKCRDTNGDVSPQCAMKRERCGDDMKNGSEICDGNDSTMCASHEVCSSSCTCMPGSQTVCGEKDGEIFYNFISAPTSVTVATPGLCEGTDLVLDFGYDATSNAWVWECEGYDGRSPACKLQEVGCGDGKVNGEEACDGNDEVCGDAAECTNLCLCLQHTIDGICGERHTSLIYDNGDGRALRASDFKLCEAGKIANFRFDEATHVWGRTCEGVGGGLNMLCFARQERCGDGIANDKEQCDDGNNASGDGCSRTCRSEGIGAFNPVRTEGCADGDVDQGEQCDDGNLIGGDGCSKSCTIESGWKCAPTSPSQCGTLECFQHGEWYSQYNIYGACCGGLDALPFQHVPEKVIGNGVEMTICYDTYIDEPYCLPFAKTPGRYLVKEGGEKKSLIVKDTCVDVYKDYYQLTYDIVHDQHSYCQYSDEPYHRTDFRDINSVRGKSAILALADHCIVKGPGSLFSRYQPNKKVSRSEFVKILIKTLLIGQEYSVQSENIPYNGDTYFTDIPQDFRGAQYIAKAYELGLLDYMTRRSNTTDFMPYKSVTDKEVIAMVQMLDIGQRLTPETIEELFLGKTYPTRADIATLMLKKFPSTFRDYLYIQGQNKAYLEKLMEKLRGKHYADQYRIILEQIYKLDGENEHFVADKYNMSSTRLAEYLRSIAK